MRNDLSKLKVILISSFQIYFKWHNIKKERIYEPMEKILIKKELYILRYDFLKFYVFFLIFYLIYKFTFCSEIRKKRGYFGPQAPEC